MLLSGAWPKSKAALFEFSEVCWGFTIINNHMVPGNVLLFCAGEGQCLWLFCCRDTACKGQPQARRVSWCGSNKCVLGGQGQSWQRWATSHVLLAEMPTRETDLEALCQLGRLACFFANRIYSWTLGGTRRLCMKAFLGFMLRYGLPCMFSKASRPVVQPFQLWGISCVCWCLLLRRQDWVWWTCYRLEERGQYEGMRSLSQRTWSFTLPLQWNKYKKEEWNDNKLNWCQMYGIPCACREGKPSSWSFPLENDSFCI